MPMATSKLFVFFFFIFELLISVINSLLKGLNSRLRMLNKLLIRALQNNVVNRMLNELSDML